MNKNNQCNVCKYKYYLTTHTHMRLVEVYSVNKLKFWAMDKNVVGKKNSPAGDMWRRHRGSRLEFAAENNIIVNHNHSGNNNNDHNPCSNIRNSTFRMPNSSSYTFSYSSSTSPSFSTPSPPPFLTPYSYPCTVFSTVCIKKNGTVKIYFFFYMFNKYMYLISYQSGINALSVAFYIILFALVNQELCHVLCHVAKSRLGHFLYLS